MKGGDGNIARLVAPGSSEDAGIDLTDLHHGIDGHDVDADPYSGLLDTWTWAELAGYFDKIVKKNPLHIELFIAVMRLVRETRGTLVDIGGGTGAFAELYYQSTSHRPITIVDPAQAMLDVAKNKNIPSVSCVRARIEDYEPHRHPAEKEPTTWVQTYAFHNFSAAVRQRVFEHLSQIIAPNELFVYGDIIFDDPPRNQRARERKAHLSLNSVGARYWMNNAEIPQVVRAAVLRHTLLDRRYAPDMTEVEQLAARYGFSLQFVWDQSRDWVEERPDEPGYLRVLALRRLSDQRPAA